MTKSDNARTQPSRVMSLPKFHESGVRLVDHESKEVRRKRSARPRCEQNAVWQVEITYQSRRARRTP